MRKECERKKTVGKTAESPCHLYVHTVNMKKSCKSPSMERYIPCFKRPFNLQVGLFLINFLQSAESTVTADRLMVDFKDK